MDARGRFLEAVDGLGIEIHPVTYPDGTHTAVDAAAAIGCDVAQIVKSLVFIATTASGEERAVLALTSGARQVDPDALAHLVGATAVRKADADEVRAATGFSIGATPPFGHPAPLPTHLDPHLAVWEHVWAAAGTPRDVFRLTPQDLVRAGALHGADFTRT